MDILGLIFLAVMTVVMTFLLLITISDQIDRMRGKKMTEAQHQRNGDGEGGWCAIITLIVCIGSPIVLLVLAYG